MSTENIIEEDRVLTSQVRECIEEKGKPNRIIVKRDVVRLSEDTSEEDIGTDRKKTMSSFLMKSFGIEAAILKLGV